MEQDHARLAFSELLEVLRDLCRKRRTGTLFIHSDTNHSVRIGIEDGTIFFCAFGRYRGMRAVAEISRIQFGRYSFADVIFKGAPPAALPPTAEILAALEAAEGGG